MLPWLCSFPPLPELITCPGCTQVYPTSDVTEYFFLQCFSAGQFKMTRVSQDKQRNSWSFSELCGAPVHKSVSLHQTHYPAIHLPNHPSIHASFYASIQKRIKMFELGKAKWEYFSLTDLTKKYQYWAFTCFFLPLSWNSCTSLGSVGSSVLPVFNDWYP